MPAITMKILISKLFACVLILTVTLLCADEKGFAPIFNGKNFDGWDSKPGMREVRTSEIWCTDKSQEKNWLIWRKDHANIKTTDSVKFQIKDNLIDE